MIKKIKKLAFIFWLKYHGFNRKRINEIIREFVKTINAKRRVTKKRYILSVFGEVGTGKTTISRKISKKLNFTYVGTDQGRRFLEQKRYPENIISNDYFLFFLAVKVLNFLIKKDTNIIIDADTYEPFYINFLEDTAKKNKYEFLLVRITAPKEQMMERINKRIAKEESDYMKKNVVRFINKRRKIRDKYGLPKNIFYEFNNESLSKQKIILKRFVEKLKQFDSSLFST